MFAASLTRVSRLPTRLNIVHLKTPTMATYTKIEHGTENSTDYRVFINSAKGPLSAFHDIPLHANAAKTVLNMVVEIPKWTNAKMEISKEEYLNPIKQDVKKGNLRYVANVFPFKGYIWNYGALPQTWEDPSHTDPATKCKGDNDPVDVCEIGSIIPPRGSVIEVKPLGVLAMIDEGETDWKVIAINVNDPMAAELNDIADVEKKMPGFLDATRDWFRKYKLPDGKPENAFAFDGVFQDKEFTTKLIAETHQQWMKLISDQTADDKIAKENVTVVKTPYLVTRDDVQSKLSQQPPFKPQPLETCEKRDKWHFV